VVSFLHPDRFTPVEEPHWIRGWVGPRAGLDEVKKTKFLTIPGLELRILGRVARSQSLYRLSYRGSPSHIVHKGKKRSKERKRHIRESQNCPAKLQRCKETKLAGKHTITPRRHPMVKYFVLQNPSHHMGYFISN
jgi:hypothetical protein